MKLDPVGLRRFTPPSRFSARRPALTAIGRLDLAAAGLLLMTDDGALTQRATSPRRGIWSVYEVELARPLQGKEVWKCGGLTTAHACAWTWGFGNDHIVRGSSAKHRPRASLFIVVLSAHPKLFPLLFSVHVNL
eukprot:350674-Chlamydomonas_euryale.AAC.6